MNTTRHEDSEVRRDGLPPALAADLGALREATGRGLPSWEQTMRRLRAEDLAKRESLPAPTRWRWAAVGTFGLALLLVALLLPISYQRVVGSEVRLTVKAERLEPAAADRLAWEFGETLGAGAVVLQPSLESGWLVLTARSAQRRPALVEAATAMFADALADEGYQVEHVTRAVKERVSGKVKDLLVEHAIAQALGLPPSLARELAGKHPDLAQLIDHLEKALKQDRVEGARVEKTADGRHAIIRLPRDVLHDARRKDVLVLLRVGASDGAAVALLSRRAPALSDSLSRELESLLRERGFEVRDVIRGGKHAIVLWRKPPPAAPEATRPGK